MYSNESPISVHQGSGLEELAPLAPAGPAATPVCVKQERAESPPATTLETLESAPHNAKVLEWRVGSLGVNETVRQ